MSMNEIHPSPVPSPTGRGEKTVDSPFPSGKRAGVATSMGATGGVVRGIGLFAICNLQFSIFNSPASASPTLARLSFWVPPQRMAEFATDYEKKIVPILKKHGLVESSERGRATPDSVFSRLFEVKTPGEVEEKQNALQGDSTWAATLRSLGTTFGTTGPDSLIRSNFMFYSAPAGPGKVIAGKPSEIRAHAKISVTSNAHFRREIPAKAEQSCNSYLVASPNVRWTWNRSLAHLRCDRWSYGFCGVFDPSRSRRVLLVRRLKRCESI